MYNLLRSILFLFDAEKVHYFSMGVFRFLCGIGFLRKMMHQTFTIENEGLEFSGGFTDLHTQSYQRILDGKGYGIEENRAAIETVEVIRVAPIVENPANPHPLLAKVK